MTALAALLGAVVGGVLLWLLVRWDRRSGAGAGPQEAEHRRQVSADLQAQLEDHRRQAEEEAAEAREKVRNEAERPIADWLNDHYGNGRNRPGSD